MKPQASLIDDPRDAALSAPAPQAPSGDALVLMFERLAINPEVDVAKLEKLIEMQERILRHNAKAEFDAAFAQMQGEIPVISEKGEIEVNGVVRSTYALNEDIQDIVRPILLKYGFSIRHRHETTDGNRIKTTGILSHRGGHSEQDEFETPPDTSGSKNNIQAIGSARSYGQRYTTMSLLNIATRGQDDDGRAAGGKPPKEPPKPPDGYTGWLEDLTLTAQKGTSELQAAWNTSKAEYRNYLTSHSPKQWEEIKVIGTKATAAQKARQ